MLACDESEGVSEADEVDEAELCNQVFVYFSSHLGHPYSDQGIPCPAIIHPSPAFHYFHSQMRLHLLLRPVAVEVTTYRSPSPSW
jgi:hypothetical protein